MRKAKPGHGWPGRPKKPDNERLDVVGVRLSADDLKQVDRYCRKHHKKRSEAIRHMIRVVLGASGYR